jgi:hypothetical protein
MLVRTLAVVAIYILFTPAFAEQLAPEEATQFILGKKWIYNCVEGTKGSGTFNLDGSATADFESLGFRHSMKFPSGTLHTENGSLCMPPIFGHDVCFKINKIDTKHWVGSSSLPLTSWFKCDFVAER